ncbi:methyltransferase domain-containing protein [Patescibacteria group bacterium]
MILLFKKLKHLLMGPKFPGSKSYWESRYTEGGSSGPGSEGRLAKYKAKTINSLTKKYGISSVIEFGCGDGNQLKQLDYKKYIGLDVSETAIKKCKEIFKGDESKRFLLIENNLTLPKTDAVLSLDVIFHLVEDEVYRKYMKDLFSQDSEYVIIYSSNSSERAKAKHVKHREFSKYVKKHFSNFNLIEVIENRYKYEADEVYESFADFYIYQKK